MRRLALALLALVLLRADMYPDAGNAKLPEAQDNLGIARSVTAYGAKCDGVTDDTAAIQAAIAANQSPTNDGSHALSLPAGRCIVGNLLVTRPLTITGQGAKHSFLVSPNGSTNPVVTVQPDGVGTYPVMVRFEKFSITSVNRIDAPGLNNVHGIKIKGSGALNLTDLTVDEVPGSCLYAAAGEANAIFVQGFNFNCLLPSQYGIAANSTSDWVFAGGLLYGATLDNILCSGCSNFHFENVNNFSAIKAGINLFNAANFFWHGGSIDRNHEHNITVDNRTANRPVYIGNTTIGYSGATTNNTYSDMLLTSQNINPVYLSSITFYDPAISPNANKPLRNITFTAGNTGLVYANNMKFLKGNWLTAGVMNTPAQYVGLEPPVAWPTSPILVGTTAGTAAMGVQVASISTRNGMAHIQGRVQATSIVGLTGNMRIRSLPLAPVTTVDEVAPCSTAVSGWTAPANFTSVVPYVAGQFSTTDIFLERQSVAGGSIAETAVTEWGGTSSISFVCDYKYIPNQ